MTTRSSQPLVRVLTVCCAKSCRTGNGRCAKLTLVSFVNRLRNGCSRCPAMCTTGLSTYRLSLTTTLCGKDGFSDKLCYVAGHTVVVLSRHDGHQTLLQGHRASITSVATTADRTVLATADSGPESQIIVWSIKSCTPVYLISNPHRLGSCAIDLCGDGHYLVSMGVVDPESGDQEIALWDLIDGDPSTPVVLSPIPKGDPQTNLAFNTNNKGEIISNGKQRTYFWSYTLPESRTFTYYSPPLNAKDFKQVVGDFTVSAFLPGSTQAVTGTVDGDVVLWEEQGLYADQGTRATDRHAVKVMRIQRGKVAYLGAEGGFLVSGGTTQVQFFDPLMRLVAWFDDVGDGLVTSVSFSTERPTKVETLDDESTRFSVPDFVAGTSNGFITAIQSRSFHSTWSEGSGRENLVGGIACNTAELVTHPLRPEFVVVGEKGRVQKWDMIGHEKLVDRCLGEDLNATAVGYFRDGSMLAIGFGTGQVFLLEGSGLEDKIHFHNTRSSIQRVACSATGRHVAIGTESQHVLIYGYLKTKRGTHRWDYVGKCASHSDQIVGLHFGESPSGYTRLFSLGLDNRLVEYDVEQSSVEKGVQIISVMKVCADGTPTAMTFGPPLSYYSKGSANTELILADTSSKVRIFSPDQKANCGTYLGPSFGSHITKILVFRSENAGRNYLAYSTADSVAGLMSWPPRLGTTTMGVIAQPCPIKSVGVSFDGRKLVTLGENGAVNLWEIDTTSMDLAFDECEKNGVDWSKIVDPDVLGEIQDYFYYTQIRCQGEDTTEERRITGRVPIDHMANLMRALGYYPSQAEIQSMTEELNYQADAKGKSAPESINFDTFLSLYIRYRPEVSISQEELENAFRTLGGPNGEVDRGRLVEMLLNNGESLPEEELLDALELLTGTDNVEEAIPDVVNAKNFAVLLGLEEMGSC
ncbi:hypothetical protein BSKO_06758 [Bryopsis sp. KO-2023]|nr:hypothetical protein BSKO_06758 [Bryopsis sp. KO-2023]